ncbi:MFS transporter [Nocardia sp. alder85J]|uniref:MFS transporter n=1 Tax=Nocardia sp. alder85J TaxID=2862949 RepID=UPI001CD800C9|nr:MFS transporter [Nocardia sp. alder85J]MCX4093238.1 MFS transporter [Nocardia sp. alder85J]
MTSSTCDTSDLPGGVGATGDVGILNDPRASGAGRAPGTPERHGDLDGPAHGCTGPGAPGARGDGLRPVESGAGGGAGGDGRRVSDTPAAPGGHPGSDGPVAHTDPDDEISPDCADYPADPYAADDPGSLTRARVLLFAVTAGTAVAGLYYLQPLLHRVASDLRLSTATAALLISAAQVGYLCGLALLVPLGDFLERRRLVPVLLMGSAVALGISAAAPNFAVLLVSMLITGVTASAAQIVVPWSSALAPPHRRGQIVGTVMSGLLLGILLSRVVSGAVAQVAGWRVMLLAGGIAELVAAASLYLLVPATGRAAAGERYPEVLASIPALIRTHAVLRHRMALGFLSMACFSGVWSSIAFLLAGVHGSGYHYDEFAIGLFGLAGVAGALGAPVVGRFADRGRLPAVTTAVWVVLLLSWGLLAWGGHSVVALIAALLVFDFGVQGVQLSNQTAVYALDPAARSRLTTAYMVTYFLGGVLGSVTAGLAYQSGGWPLVCEIGTAATALGLALWGLFAWRTKRAKLAPYAGPNE